MRNKGKHEKRPAFQLPQASAIPRRVEIGLLVVILLLAAALRLANFGSSPPGLNQDEAANAWNAWCLLKTGKDQIGKPWPIFYCRELGSNYSTLHLYLLMPFQMIGGLNVYTARVPMAVGGILTVLLIYWVGRRMAGPLVGLMSAAMLAVNPWHLFMSRWGGEANLVPLLLLLPLAALLWARLPIGQPVSRPPSIWLSAVAGAIIGICCYGYPSVRLFLPLLGMACVVLNWRAWLKLLKTRQGHLAVLAAVVTVAVIFGPLAYRHVAHPEEISKRTQDNWVWQKYDSPSTTVGKVFARYAGHFSPGFLFVHGDRYHGHALPGRGYFHWYMLPLMLAGLYWLVRSWRSFPAGQLVLVWVLLFPASDALTAFEVGGIPSLHALRSSTGVVGLVWLGACGAVYTGLWLRHRKRVLLPVAAGVLALAAVTLNVRYLVWFYRDYPNTAETYHFWQRDLVEVCKWLKPRLDDVDAAFFTMRGNPPDDDKPGIIGFNQPYICMVVALDYDPHDWVRRPPGMIKGRMFDTYYRLDKFIYMYSLPVSVDRQVRVVNMGAYYVQELAANGRPDRVLFFIRPWEYPGLRDALGLGSPIHEFRRPDGQAVLWVFERFL